MRTDLFSPSWKEQLESLVNTGYKAGSDLVEIFIERTDNTSLLAEEDIITNVSPSYSLGAGIRIFKGHQDAFVSTNDVTQTGMNTALEEALRILGLETSVSDYSGFEGFKAIKDYATTKQQWYQSLPNLDEASSILLNGTKSLEMHGRYLQVRRAMYSRGWQEVLIAASDGTYGHDIRLNQSIGLNVLAEDGSNRSSVGRRYGSSSTPDAIRRWDPSKSAEEICNSASKMLYAEYIEAGQMPVVLANKFGGVIFHEACGHLLETTQIERGTSPFAEKMNELIAHPSVTAIDEGTTEGAFGSISMDDEGMEPQQTLLIENGILKAFLSDRAGELRTGHRRTGSGRRQGHSFAAASRMRNTFIAAGKYSPDELINSIDDGLYCKSMGGGSVGPTGQFNFSVEEAYRIKDGVLREPLKGATLIGEAKQIMPRISMCANDLELAAGYCGSISGNINVTVGQPHIKVDSITIGGR